MKKHYIVLAFLISLVASAVIAGDVTVSVTAPSNHEVKWYFSAKNFMGGYGTSGPEEMRFNGAFRFWAPKSVNLSGKASYFPPTTRQGFTHWWPNEGPTQWAHNYPDRVILQSFKGWALPYDGVKLETAFYSYDPEDKGRIRKVYKQMPYNWAEHKHKILFEGKEDTDWKLQPSQVLEDAYTAVWDAKLGKYVLVWYINSPTACLLVLKKDMATKIIEKLLDWGLTSEYKGTTKTIYQYRTITNKYSYQCMVEYKGSNYPTLRVVQPPGFPEYGNIRVEPDEVLYRHSITMERRTSFEEMYNPKTGEKDLLNVPEDYGVCSESNPWRQVCWKAKDICGFPEHDGRCVLPSSLWNDHDEIKRLVATKQLEHPGRLLTEIGSFMPGYAGGYVGGAQ